MIPVDTIKPAAAGRQTAQNGWTASRVGFTSRLAASMRQSELAGQQGPSNHPRC